MRYARWTVITVVIGMSMLPACSKSADKKNLTREVFAAALSKCQPLDAKFISNVDGPPSVEITVPNTSSTVPDCMARQFDGYALKAIQISINRSQTGSGS